MPSLTQTEILPYTPEQLFALVSDVARYPEFLPWCRAARILERGQGSFLAELVITFKGMTEQYTSRVSLTEPTPETGGEGRIDVELVRGPFHHLVNRWHFQPQGEGACTVEFFLDFRFKSRMLEKLIGGMFERASARMVEAFTLRAGELYGRKLPENGDASG